MVWWLVAFAPPYTCLWCRSGELLSSSEISRWEIESNSQVKWTLIRYQSIKMAQMVGKSSCSCYSTHLEVTNSSTGHGLELGCGLIFLFTHYGNKLCIACDLVSCKSTSDNEIIWSQKGVFSRLHIIMCFNLLPFLTSDKFSIINFLEFFETSADVDPLIL